MVQLPDDLQIIPNFNVVDLFEFHGFDKGYELANCHNPILGHLIDTWPKAKNSLQAMQAFSQYLNYNLFQTISTILDSIKTDDFILENT